MPDNNKVMTQIFYEKQSKLYELYKESFNRKEMNVQEVIAALRILGFSNTIASRRVNEWAAEPNSYAPETEKAKKRRFQQRNSLEKYILRMRLGKKYIFLQNDPGKP